MKKCTLPAILALNLFMALPTPAQTFKTLHSFTDTTDGANPLSGVVLSGGTLFGVTTSGGASEQGAIFRLNTDGNNFTNLYSFSLGGYNSALNRQTNTDGASPFSVILANNTLYGVAFYGGNGGEGTVFALEVDGTGFSNLHSFASPSPGGFGNADGSFPRSILTLSGTTLYGAAQFGGSADSGSIFSVETNGDGFTNLYTFTNGADGSFPESMVRLGNVFYGTADWGGSSGDGSIFAINADGSAFTNIYSFTTNNGYPAYSNIDGAYPVCKLVLSGNKLYGATTKGGTGGVGTIFAVNLDGTGFVNLHNFTAPSGPLLTNNDGATPVGGLLLSGSMLYGVASAGGTGGTGTIFALTTNGSAFVNLHNFSSVSATFPALNSDGAGPVGTLILSSNTLFGTARVGGSSGVGAVFSLTLPPPPALTIARSGANVILSWPTNAIGFPFTLESTTNLLSATDWIIIDAENAAVLNGKNTVTNHISGIQQFYRLSN